jgi:hypothetical protein
VTVVPVPPAVDQALKTLANRQNVPKELNELLLSVFRTVLRTFTTPTFNPADFAKLQSRLERCFAVLASAPSIDADGGLAADLARLAEAIVAASGGPSAIGSAALMPGPPTAAPTVEPPVPPLRPPVRLPPTIERQPELSPPSRAEMVERALPERHAEIGRPPAASAEPPAPAAAALPAAARAFLETTKADVERDWYWFVLVELNGFGTQLAYQRGEGDATGAALTEARVRATLDTLAWDTPAALRQTWAFTAERLRDAEDAWGPHVILAALEPQVDVVRVWRDGLSAKTKAVISEVPFEMRRGGR